MAIFHSLQRLAALGVLIAGSALAQTPVVHQVLNNFGLVPEGLLHYHGIAQGSIFIVTGRNLANQETGLQSVPLRSTLNGVRVRVTNGTTTTYAWLYYVLPNQVAGILPSNTPVGTGQLVVENNGRNSAPADITVVKSAFGVLAVTGDGKGMAAVHDDAANLLSKTNSTNPGKTVVFYGSGLGGVIGDESVEQIGANASGDLTGVNVSVRIGDKLARITYRGRTQFPGLDQINVIVPELDAYDCEVPVSIRAGDLIANAVTVPVAQHGSVCEQVAPPNLAVAFASPLTTEEAATLAAKGTIRMGAMNVLAVGEGNIDVRVTPPVLKFDRFQQSSVSFADLSGPELATYVKGPTFPAGCDIALPVPPLISQQSIDAGQSFSFRSTHAAYPLTLKAPGVFGEFTSTGDRGVHTVVAPGGRDVPAFRVSFPMEEIVWTNSLASSLVNRAEGLTITWSSPRAASVVIIELVSNAMISVGAMRTTCIAKASDGQFTVPASVLGRFPASPLFAPGTTNPNRMPGSITVTGLTNYKARPEGLDLFQILVRSGSTRFVVYQ